MRIASVVVSAAAVVALALPAAAGAASVREAFPGTVEYRAAPGERNHLEIRNHGGPSVLVRDTGAPLRVGSRCRRVDGHTALCRVGPTFLVTAHLGDLADTAHVDIPARSQAIVSGGRGDDRLTGDATFYGNEGDDIVRLVRPRSLPASVEMYAFGGDGRDVLVGTSGNDELDGQSGEDVLYGLGGDDTLIGGQARDRLYGGPGDDVLYGDAPTAVGAYADLIDGGPGSDTASWQGSTQGVHVDLEQPGDAGAPGEHDRLVSIENVVGSTHDDVLLGDDGPNVLDDGQEWSYSHPTADRIEGRGGDDRIVLWVARPQDTGAPLSCGAGSDVVQISTQEPALSGDCEWVTGTSAEGSLTVAPPAASGGAVSVAYRYRPAAFSASVTCAVQADLRDATTGADLGSARSALDGAHPSDGTLTVPLNAAGQAAAADHRAILVDASTVWFCGTATERPGDDLRFVSAL